MKTTKTLVTLLLAASATSLTAIERPVPAEQPKEKKNQEVKPQPRAQALPMPKAAMRPYLGVMGDRISDAMSAQLNIDPDAGLTLLLVEEGSPADKAGLKKHDIITKLGGMNVGNQNQLREAIMKHKPNANVELSYISGGKAITKQVKLGSAPMVDLAQPRNNQGGNIMPKLNGQIPGRAIPLDMLQNLPPEHRQQLQQLLEGNLNQLDMGNLKRLDLNQLQKQFDGFNGARDMQPKMRDLMKLGFQNKGRMKMVDPDGSVTLETDGDNKSIELHDAEGKLQYKGPYNNEADKLRIPKNLRERANKLKFNDKPNALRIPDFKQLRGLQNLENLLNDLEPLEGKVQGFALPQGGNLGNGQRMQKFQFKLNGKDLTQNSSRSLLGPDGNRYTQTQNKDGKEIEIKDPQGQLLFSGPYNTSSDKQMVPEEYRPSLESLDAMGGLMKGNLKDGLRIEIAPKQ